jgi:hypothetical protein
LRDGVSQKDNGGFTGSHLGEFFGVAIGPPFFIQPILDGGRGIFVLGKNKGREEERGENGEFHAG